MACKNQLCCYTPTNQYVHVIAWQCSGAKGMGGNFPTQEMQKTKHSTLVTATEGSMCLSMGCWETSHVWGFGKV